MKQLNCSSLLRLELFHEPEFQRHPTVKILSFVKAGVLVLSLASCTAPYYDPSPRNDRALHEIGFDSPLSVERSMRVLYARLDDCVGSAYHVQPRFHRAEGRAWVMVVSGLGLDRYSVLGNRFEARFEVTKATAGSQVQIIYVEPSLAPVVEMSRSWLTDGTRGCGS